MTMPRYYQEAAYLYGKLEGRQNLDNMPLHHMYIRAHSAAEARQTCKELVAEQTGRNAFSRLAIRTDDENGQQKVYDFYGKGWVEKQNKLAAR